MTAKRYLDVFETYNRFLDGKHMSSDDWDYRYIPLQASTMKERYNIDFGGKIIPEDQDLVDRLFVAGVDMLLTCGIYNPDTGTCLKITEDEIYEGLKMAPNKIVLGEGKDEVTCGLRRGNTINRPIIEGGPTGTQVSEDIFIPVIESYAQETVVDTIVSGAPKTIKGYPSLKNTPWEIRGTLMEINYTRDALYKVGRPGMAI